MEPVNKAERSKKPARTPQQERFYERVSSNRKNCSFDDISRLLEAYGYVAKTPGSSHYTFRQHGRLPITVPKAKPVKTVYVRQVLDMIDELENEKLTELKSKDLL